MSAGNPTAERENLQGISVDCDAVAKAIGADIFLYHTNHIVGAHRGVFLTSKNYAHCLPEVHRHVEEYLKERNAKDITLTEVDLNERSLDSFIKVNGWNPGIVSYFIDRFIQPGG